MSVGVGSGKPSGMSVPPQVLQMLDQLDEDVYQFYVQVARTGGSPVSADRTTQIMSRLLARYLLRQGWWQPCDRPDLPVCVTGNPLCFDTGPHDHADSHL